MKQLALILLFIPIGLFAQADQKDETLKKETDTEKSHSRMYLILEKKHAEEAAEKTAEDAARSAAMEAPLSEIIIPLEVDLNNYTHLALVSLNGRTGRDKAIYNSVASTLMSSPFVIVNPTENKKLFKKNPLYLKDSKHPSWLYLYYSKSQLGVNELRDMLVRDSNNKIIYSSKNRNVSFQRVISPLINF